MRTRRRRRTRRSWRSGGGRRRRRKRTPPWDLPPWGGGPLHVIVFLFTALPIGAGALAPLQEEYSNI
eukprot:9424626-Pyramimonas_sp.AAC.1